MAMQVGVGARWHAPIIHLSILWSKSVQHVDLDRVSRWFGRVLPPGRSGPAERPVGKLVDRPARVLRGDRIEADQQVRPAPGDAQPPGPSLGGGCKREPGPVPAAGSSAFAVAL